MFGRKYAAAMINRSAETEADRRRFMSSAGLAGLGVVGASTLVAGSANAEKVRADAAAAGILAVEAYHAANVRTSFYTAEGGLLGTGLFARDLRKAAGKLSTARDSLDGRSDDDQGIVNSRGAANIVPADANGIAYGRKAANVLNVVYLTPKKATSGGFFPHGVNGDITASNDNS